MNSDGTVSSNVKISDGLAGFTPSNLEANDNFGSSVANIGDFNKDGIVDLATGATSDENSDSAEGALYVMFMDSDFKQVSFQESFDMSDSISPDVLRNPTTSFEIF